MKLGLLVALLCWLQTAKGGGCGEGDLALYSVELKTHWTRANFPKQYPANRPPAHWSKLVGMSHDENFVLFRIGEIAGEDFKLFAETGKTDTLGKQNKSLHVFDEFSSSSIKTGAGKTQVNFFVDGNHHMVSLAVKIIPSPDWFIGVDSLALCVEGNWLDSVIIEASPMDAGTDSGFTFTAPNWETEPREKISKITSKYPRHPANSFYYPKLRDLPVIATFHIVKKKFYHMTKKINVGEDEYEKVERKMSYWPKRLSAKKDGQRMKFRKFYRRKKQRDLSIFSDND